MAGKPGRKPRKSLEERIEQITNDIETYEQSISTLVSKREELLKEKRERDLSELYELIENKNLTIEDVQTLVEDYEKEKQGEVVQLQDVI